MDKQTNTGEKTIEINTGDDDMTFVVGRDDYIKFVNGATKNSFNAMQNLLAATVVKDDEQKLSQLVANPANVTELAGAVLEQYQPDVTATVKKPSK